MTATKCETTELACLTAFTDTGDVTHLMPLADYAGETDQQELLTVVSRILNEEVEPEAVRFFLKTAGYSVGPLGVAFGRLAGAVDSVVMNPPFTRAADVAHVRHALTLLAPGGRLVSVVAPGPKQRAALQTTAAQWIDLPPHSFRSECTDVNAAIVIFNT